MLMHEVSLRDVKFGVWCITSATRTVGLIFCETLSAHRCVVQVRVQFLDACPITRDGLPVFSKRVQ